MQSIDPIRLVQDGLVYSICLIPIITLRFYAEPYHRGFFCDDESIRYPYHPDTIPTTTLMVVGVIVALIIILAVETYRLYVIEQKIEGYALLNGSTVTIDIPEPTSNTRGMYIGDRLIHPLLIRFSTFAGPFLFGAAISDITSEVGKVSVGELRPYFLAACQPDWTKINCTGQYISDYTCMTTDLGTLKEARQSFPSGHASFSAYCACWIVIYLDARASWPLASNTGRLWRPLVQYALVLAAFVTGLTRIADNQHHGTDVMAGFALGAVTAWAFCYHFEICGWFGRKNSDCRNCRWIARSEKRKGSGDCSNKETEGLLNHC